MKQNGPHIPDEHVICVSQRRAPFESLLDESGAVLVFSDEARAFLERASNADILKSRQESAWWCSGVKTLPLCHCCVAKMFRMSWQKNVFMNFVSCPCSKLCVAVGVTGFDPSQDIFCIFMSDFCRFCYSVASWSCFSPSSPLNVIKTRAGHYLNRPD